MYATIFVLTLDEIDGVSAIMPKVKKEWAESVLELFNEDILYK